MLFSLKLYVGKSHTIKNHLLSFGIEKLEQTGAKHIVNGEEIKARKKTCNKWFETQDQIGYYKEFAKPKIMYPNMTSVFPFTYDETGSFGNDKSFIITKKESSQNLPKGTENVIASEAECHPERSLEPKAIGEVEGSSEVLQVNKVPEPAEGPSAAVEKCVSTLETQVNTLVYQLYGISDAEEIDAVEKR